MLAKQEKHYKKECQSTDTTAKRDPVIASLLNIFIRITILKTTWKSTFCKLAWKLKQSANFMKTGGSAVCRHYNHMASTRISTSLPVICMSAFLDHYDLSLVHRLLASSKVYQFELSELIWRHIWRQLSSHMWRQLLTNALSSLYKITISCN